MPFPVTIDASVGGAEQPGKFSTYLNGANRYQIQFVLGASTAQLAAYKSTDGGATWSAVGTGPIATWPGVGYGVVYTCVQVGPLIYVIYIDNSVGQYAVTTFDMGSDTWGAVLASTQPPFGVFLTSAEGSFNLPQICASYRALTGDILCILPGDGVTLTDVPHRICCFAMFNIAGSTWNSWADLGYVDYADITTWDLLPCGMVTDSASGRTTVLMQQVARSGPGNLQSFQYTGSGANEVDIPLDAPTSVNVLAWGAGGGGNTGTDIGSGGGGGAFKAGSVTVVPGDSYTATVGAGGTSGSDGTASVFETVTADPGLAGSSGALATGGAGGAGDHAGGAGGTTNSGGTTGGGGGGSATATADGTVGSDGGATEGGIGGAGQGSGGAGGNDNPFNPPTGGQAGGAPGGGGGGHGGADLTTPGGNNGGDGEIDISWTSVRNTHDCRMYQQAINSDNTLGSLAEITQGAYPSRAKNAAPVPLTCDIATFGGDVWITFTGATSTSGRDNISVGTGATADPVGFSFQIFSSGNGSNDIDSCPALAVGAAAAFCCYISAPSAGPISFLSRADVGLGFGGPVSIGTLTLPDDREFGRLQASVLAAVPEITFGTPTTASLALSSLD